MNKENKEQFEERMKAEGYSQEGFGWIKKTKLGCVIIYRPRPKTKQIPHAFLGRGKRKQILTRRGNLRKRGRKRND